MNEQAVKFEKKEAVGIITLNRPERQNAVNADMAAALKQIAASAGWGSGINVFLLRAEGNDFCVGTDPESMAAYGDRRDQISFHSAAERIASLQQPVIAAIDGAAYGQGLELALACDIRIASDRASFSMDQINMDEMPFDGGTQRLPRLIGRMKAMEMMLFGDAMDAQAAKEAGLIHRIVPPESLTQESSAAAEELAAKGPVALRHAKEALLKGMDMTLAQGLRLEADLYFLLHTTRDRREGIEAFRAKRPPKFTGE